MESPWAKPIPKKASRDTVHITPLDYHIAQHGGLTASIERLPHLLQNAKSKTTTDTNQRLEELVRENGRLREEIAFHQDTQRALMSSYTASVEAFETLKESLQVTSERMLMSEQRLLKYWGIEPEQSKH